MPSLRSTHSCWFGCRVSGDGEANGDSIARTRAAQEGFANKVIFESTLEPGGAGEGYCCWPGWQRRSWQTLSGTQLRLAGWVSLRSPPPPPAPLPQPSRPRLDSKEFPPRAAGLSAQAGFIHKRDADLGARSGGQAFLPRSPSWPPPTSLGGPPGASSRAQRHPGTGPAIPEKVAPQDRPARNGRLPTFCGSPP